MIGTFANTLAQNHPSRAHAVLKDNADGTFTASVRAPLEAPHGADMLCRQFETGGGRAAAAGIDRLPVSRLEEFITVLRGLSGTCAGSGSFHASSNSWRKVTRSQTRLR